MAVEIQSGKVEVVMEKEGEEIRTDKVVGTTKVAGERRMTEKVVEVTVMAWVKVEALYTEGEGEAMVLHKEVEEVNWVIEGATGSDELAVVENQVEVVVNVEVVGNVEVVEEMDALVEKNVGWEGVGVNN